MRVSLKRATFVLLAIVIIASAYYSYYFPPVTAELETPYEVLAIQNTFDVQSFSASDKQLKQDIHYTNYLYSGYHNFTKLYFGNVARVKKLPLAKKCNDFFDQFTRNNPNWKYSVWLDQPEYSRQVVDKHAFFIDQYRLMKDMKDKVVYPEWDKVAEDEKQIINNKFKKVAKSTKLVQRGMADTATLSRLYGKCFLNNDDPNMDRERFKQYSSKLFPFLNRLSLPTFQRLGRDAIVGPKTATVPEWLLPPNTFPIFDEYDEYTGKYHQYYADTGDMIDFLHKKSSGRGIVLSASTEQTKDIVKLIRVLRALNNRLPIQIVFRGDIDGKSKEILEIVATKGIDFLLHPDMAKEHKEFLPELDLMEHYREFGSEFPIQDIWLVNAVRCIKPKYMSVFRGFFNKILAYTFNSFREVILLDVDTVPLVPITDFFESEEYKQSGTFFFKDRTVRLTNDYLETNMISHLFHTNEVSIDDLFDIPKITDKTMSNRYMTGWEHFQEAGVVVINRHDHFLGVLMTLQLIFWGNTLTDTFWGDKEMYWIGLAMAGDENYEFNPNSAASVGELTKNNDHLHYGNTSSQELCSTHPGQVDKYGRLLWINSGFLYCKNNGYDREMAKFPFALFEKERLKSMFNDPIKLRAALVPPDMPNYRDAGSPIDDAREVAFKNSWNRRLPDFDEIKYNIEEGEQEYARINDYGPQKSWVSSGVCFGYLYCAYSDVASYEKAGEFVRGHVFEYTKQQTRMFDYLAKVWVTGNSRIDPPPPPKELLPEETPIPETTAALQEVTASTQEGIPLTDIPQPIN